MSIESENLYRQEMMGNYRKAVSGLFRYIPWLTEKQGTETSHIYKEGELDRSTLPVIIYDSTLLALVKEFQATGLMDPNYRYTITRNNLYNSQDELAFIERTELKDIKCILDVIAKYVLGGMTKGVLWNEAVMNGVFLTALVRLKELLEVYDKPLA